MWCLLSIALLAVAAAAVGSQHSTAVKASGHSIKMHNSASTGATAAGGPSIAIGGYRLGQLPAGFAPADAGTTETYTVKGASVSHSFMTLYQSSASSAAPPAAGPLSAPDGTAITVSVQQGLPSPNEFVAQTAKEFGGTTVNVAGGSGVLFSPAPGWRSVLWLAKNGDVLQVSSLNQSDSLLQSLAAQFSPEGQG